MERTPSLTHRLLRQKPIDQLVEETRQEGKHLKRSISLFQLTMFGVGATIGTGIFFVLSQQVPVAGPAVLISFIIAGITAGLTALCYAELSSMIPASGSSYSYAYATLGEGVAFLVAACLILEYGVSAAAVAIGWSEYLNNLSMCLACICRAGCCPHPYRRTVIACILAAMGYQFACVGFGVFVLCTVDAWGGGVCQGQCHHGSGQACGVGAIYRHCKQCL